MVLSVNLDNNELVSTFGNKSFNVSKQLLTNVMAVSSGGNDCTNENVNFAFDFIKEIKPQDTIEAMLAIQMLGTHLLSCKTIYGANLSNQSKEVVSENINRATKLTRTFIAQMDTLKKYRNKDGQRITVEHINVNDGGKIAIGETNTQISNNLKDLIVGGVGVNEK